MRYSYATDSCSQSPTSEYIAYHYDHIGNVVALTDGDGNGTLREAFDMEAFGKVHQGSQTGIHLTTKEYHSESGLYYFNQRWYDKSIWIEPEPLGLDGPNLYHFNYNDPINGFDPNGLLRYWHPRPAPKVPTDPDMKRRIDKMKESCGGGTKLEGGSAACCCQDIKDMYLEAWGLHDNPGLAHRIGVSGAASGIQHCANQCSGKTGKTGTELLQEFSKCAANYQAYYNPFAIPGVPTPYDPGPGY